MKQVKQVVMLPTKKRSNIGINNEIGSLNKGKLYLFSPAVFEEAQHIYFTDNSEEEEGDYAIDLDANVVFKVGKWETNNAIKIVASTDRELTPNSWIPESFVKKFIEMYNAGTPITEVNVDVYDANYIGQIFREPKTREDGSIIISNSKTYTREEVISLIKEHRNGLVTVKDKEIEYTNRFIEENL
jgi:sulfur relay (sulfurtransferase) DsrC/TusE family protein